MRRGAGLPSLGQGTAAALVLSLCGAASLAVLAPLLGAAAALRAVIAVLGLAYVLYLLGRAEGRVGRATTLAVWSVASAAAWMSAPPLGAYLLLHVGMVSAVRALYFRRGPLPALADLGLGLLGAAFGVWAGARTGGLLLAFWCFFLVQAFSVSIPAAAGPARPGAADADRGAPTLDASAAFDRAHRAALAALRRLAAR